MSLTSTTFGVVVLLIPPLVLITVHFIDISEAFYPDTQFQFFDVINDETTAFYGQEIDYESSEKKRQKEVYNSDGAPISDDFNISLLDDSATVSSKSSTAPEVISKSFDRVRHLPIEFSGDSYIEHEGASDLNIYLQLTFSVRPSESDGLLFLHRTSHRYFAAYLEDGYFNIQYSLGGDSVILRSEHPLKTGRWQQIEVWRSGRAALIKVGKQQWIENAVTEELPDVASNNSVYIGGAPEDALPLDLDRIEGFSGCLKRLHMNGHSIRLIDDALSVNRVHECGWNPCEHWRCEGNALCKDIRASAVCMCQYPRKGMACELEETNASQALQFSTHSYLRLADRKFMEHVMGEVLSLSFSIKPKEIDGKQSRRSDQVLAYSGDEDNVGDYFKLILTEDSTVRFMINLGSGTVSLDHPSILEPYEWHNISVSREREQISVTVDSISISTKAPPDSIELNVYDALFIGGIPLPSSESIGFNGCMQSIKVGSEEFTHPLNATEAINILNCAM